MRIFFHVASKGANESLYSMTRKAEGEKLKYKFGWEAKRITDYLLNDPNKIKGIKRTFKI